MKRYDEKDLDKMVKADVIAVAMDAQKDARMYAKMEENRRLSGISYQEQQDKKIEDLKTAMHEMRITERAYRKGVVDMARIFMRRPLDGSAP